MKKQLYQEEFVKLGGIEQYLLHYPQPSNGPVILFLNGGPGSAESNFGYYFNQYWPDVYQVVYWDQRGAGKTLNRHPDANDFPTIESLLNDLDELVDYLKIYYQKDKIVLLGDSWGTVLGSQYAIKKPENVLMYIGVGQVVDTQRNEQIGLSKVIEEADKAGNVKDKRALMAIERFPPKMDEAGMKLFVKVRKYQMKYNLAAKLTFALVKTFVCSPVFKCADVIAIKKAGKANHHLIDYLFSFNLNEAPLTYDMPMCLIQGENDYQVQTSLAVDYFKRIETSQKQIHVIPKAGHMAMCDQPELFAKALNHAYRMIQL
ncbi:alpha/beta hydrolase [Vagococcus sp. BWB3-3]|uniref:Alpha/beta hydrolase n=1 Tax=Vagococcus allomyrinae TaxID=2794353 RepID=A0A940P9K6_9ENTE|nr:alpha/beta hydrolase [Vagococcus allomyrinae]